MAEPVVQAETQLAVCVGLMRELLQSTAEDALPQSMLGDAGLERFEVTTSSPSGNDPHSVPDTLQQRLDWEQQREEERIRTAVGHVQLQVNQLRACVAALGGAVSSDGRFEDVPTAVLDDEIARLGTENSRLATQMISLYDEAAAACATLENELFTAQVPPI